MPPACLPAGNWNAASQTCCSQGEGSQGRVAWLCAAMSGRRPRPAAHSSFQLVRCPTKLQSCAPASAVMRGPRRCARPASPPTSAAPTVSMDVRRRGGFERSAPLARAAQTGAFPCCFGCLFGECPLLPPIAADRWTGSTCCTDTELACEHSSGRHAWCMLHGKRMGCVNYRLAPPPVPCSHVQGPGWQRHNQQEVLPLQPAVLPRQLQRPGLLLAR